MSTSAGSASRLVLLDGLRGLAAIAVMLMHDGIVYGPEGIFSRSYLSVDLFFLLSGFVLTLAYERKFAGGFGPLSFMRARIGRLWPVLACGVALGAIMAMMHDVLRPMASTLLLTNIVLLPLPRQEPLLYWLNAPAWSLACEFVVNLLHVLILWKLTNRGLAIVSAFAGIGLTFSVVSLGSADLGAGWDNWYGGYLRVLFAYPLGILMARTWRDRGSFSVHWLTGLLAPMAFILLLPAVNLPPEQADVLACILIVPALFWVATRAGEPPARMLPLLSWLGAISYPVYAFNWPLIYLGLYLSRHADPAYADAFRFGAIAAAILLSHAAVVIGRMRRASIVQSPKPVPSVSTA
ncbi:MAG: acyltransferase [Novosphingobium sp.]|nr:acyltransferase [Novosphingobium sp.]